MRCSTSTRSRLRAPSTHNCTRAARRESRSGTMPTSAR
jgi:hypothetical protein